MKKILFILAMLVILSSFAYAEQQSLGVFKKYSCIDLLQNCANCTYVNFTSVYYPNGTKALSNVEATKDNSDFNYTFCDTNIEGIYKVNGIGDVEPDRNKVFAYYFEINNAGRETSPNTIIAVIAGLGIVCFLFMFFAFHLDENHYLLKILLIFFSIFTMILIPTVLINGDYSIQSLFMNIPIWFFRIFVTYFLVYLFWDWVKRNQTMMDLFRR